MYPGGSGYDPRHFLHAASPNPIPSRSQSYNSNGQNPCEIAGSLQAPCLGYCASPIRLSCLQRNSFHPNVHQPSTNLDRLVTAPTTLPLRKTIPLQRIVAAIRSSIACTVLVLSVSLTVPQPQTREHFSQRQPSRRTNLARFFPNSWQFWSQFCDSVYVTQWVPSACFLVSVRLFIAPFRYPFSIPFNASVPHWAYLNDTVSELV